MDYKRRKDGTVINTNTHYHESCGRLAIIQYLCKHRAICGWDDDREKKIIIARDSIDHEKTVLGSSRNLRSDIICKSSDGREVHIEIVNTRKVSKEKFENYRKYGCIVICVYIKDIIREFYGDEEKIRKEIRKELGNFDFNKNITIFDYSLQFLNLNKKKISYISYFEDSQSVVLDTLNGKIAISKIRNEHVKNMLAEIYGKKNVFSVKEFYGMNSFEEYLSNIKS